MRSFRQFTVEEIIEYIFSYEFKRKIHEIHFHHTWKPTKKDYLMAEEKEKVIVSMWRYHTEVRGWVDIGQHFSVAPDGTIWDGRDLNINPASIKGRNKGAIAIEHIGNFDEEILEGEQLKASISLISALINRIFELQGEKPIITFHREFSSKTCPGINIQQGDVIEMVSKNSNMLFNDVLSDNPYYKIIEQAKNLGVIKGDSNGNFRPKDPLTREEGVIIAMRLYEILKNKENKKYQN